MTKNKASTSNKTLPLKKKNTPTQPKKRSQSKGNTPTQNHSQSTTENYSQPAKPVRGSKARKAAKPTVAAKAGSGTRGKKPTKGRVIPSSGSIPPDGWVTAKVAAGKIGCDLSNIARLCRANKLTAKKIKWAVGAPAWFIDPKSIKAFMAEEQPTGYPRGRPR